MNSTPFSEQENLGFISVHDLLTSSHNTFVPPKDQKMAVEMKSKGNFLRETEEWWYKLYWGKSPAAMKEWFELIGNNSV